MINALPWNLIFGLIFNIIYRVINKVDDNKQMKIDFFAFIEKIHDHSQVPVELNNSWQDMIKKHKDQLEKERAND